MQPPNFQPRATMSLNSTAGPSASAEIPTHRSSGEPIPTSEQLMQVDQAITLTLQEIDANFAKCHQTITGKILPSIRRYGIASHNTWQGAKFWHRFFETASDINLVPTYEGEHGDGTTSQEPSYTSQDQEASTSFSPSFQLRRGHSGEEEEAEEENSSRVVAGQPIGPDDSGEIDERDFEPPRLSDASRAATERLRGGENARSKTAAWASLESPFDRLRGVVENDFTLHDDDALREPAVGSQVAKGQEEKPMTSLRDKHASATPKKAGGSTMASRLLRTQHEQIRKSAGKVQATPKRGGPTQGNPFAAGREAHALTKEEANRWNGIADLRKTPLAKMEGDGRKRKEAAGVLNGNLDDSIDSLGWPAGMSPPVTMQFSVPQKKYSKTPAKAAASLAVNDLLRTIEGASPATRRMLMQQQGMKQGAMQGGLTSTPLKKATRKGRKSLPTPPTVTKRMGSGTQRLSRGIQDGQSPAGISSARLLDEDEGGDDVGLDEEQGDDLDVGLSKLNLVQASAHIDKLLQVGEDDDDSEEEESDSEEEEENGLQARTGRLPPIQDQRNGSDYPTSSSVASNSRSIDQDTLFGIRDPHKVATQHSATKSLSSSSDFQSSSTRDGSSQPTYQPLGAHLYEQGTVYGGRPLLGDDREDTYSAPSPTPATALSRRSK